MPISSPFPGEGRGPFINHEIEKWTPAFAGEAEKNWSAKQNARHEAGR
jgi:hypothetical protein